MAPNNLRQFDPGLFIADENGNIFYFKRPQDNPEQLIGTLVSHDYEKWDFASRDELTAKQIFSRDGISHDNSIAIVKMLLTLGVTTAAIPKGSIYPGTDENGQEFTNLSTSYVINLASFDKQHAYWPNDTVPRIAIASTP
jgi:hypothetical protein